MKLRPKIKNRTTFLGNLARQAPKSLAMWELLLNKGKFTRIIELGTWQGALSLYFALFCIERDMEFYTYDHIDYLQTPLKKLIDFNKYFYKLDIYKNIDKIGALVSAKGKTLLFCDGGNKIAEFNSLSKFLKIGDVIGTHDWGIEIKLEDIDHTCKKNNLKILKVVENQEINTNIQLFEKRSWEKKQCARCSP